MSNKPIFKDAIHLENSLDYASSISLDGEAVTISFSNLALHFVNQGESQLLTQTISFVLPIARESDLTMKLNIVGALGLDAGIRATVVVHHAGQTMLVSLPNTLPQEQSNGSSDIKQQFCAPLPVGHDYRVALVLLLERFAMGKEEVTGFLQIDLLDIELKEAE